MEDQLAKTNGHKKIIYFDALGFGWVLDNMALKKINLNQYREEIIVDQVLADITHSAKAIDAPL